MTRGFFIFTAAEFFMGFYPRVRAFCVADESEHEAEPRDRVRARG